MVIVLPRFPRVLPDLILLAVALACQALAARWLLGRVTGRVARRGIVAAAGLSFALMIFGFLLRFDRVLLFFPGVWIVWERGLAIIWILLSLSWLAGFALLQLGRLILSAGHHPARRHFLSAVRAVLFAAPPAVLAYGTFVERTAFRLREQKLEIPGLPADLDGLRLVQLTDIHLSPFLRLGDLERAVAMANETRADVALVTGDLITTRRDPMDDCLRALAALRAGAGVYGCLGNHEVFAGGEEHAERVGASFGLRFLRHAAAPLRFGNATLNLAGVDYQRTGRPYLRGAEELIVPGAVNLLLSHNPDVFPVAAGQGYALTVSGHTHGGQVRVEILGGDLNVARFYTPFVDGVYRQGAASLFVSRGLGTIGVPTRLGAPPEVALLRLSRA